MRVLVTGGAGFIGSNFILYWLKNHPKDDIINLDKLTYAGNKENLCSIENNSRYTFIQGDICDKKVVFKAMSGADVVVHFAAESHVDRSISDPSVFIKTNVVGTQVLLGQAVKFKIKHFHHISTDEVFGSLNISDTNKFNERTSYNPRSPYAASKASSDFLVRSFFHTYGLPITITNCSNNFGPYQHPEKIIPLAITNLMQGKKIPVYGDGLNQRDWLFVEDHCLAIDLVISRGKTGETYCVGGLTEGISNLDLIKKILKILNKDETNITFIKDRLGHDRKYSIDWSKINRELGWKPVHDLDSWLKVTVDWYRRNFAWWKKIKNADWHKYYQKQYEGGSL